MVEEAEPDPGTMVPIMGPTPEWVDHVLDEAQGASPVALVERVQFNDFFRMEGRYPGGVCQVYQFPNVRGGDKDTPAYVICAMCYTPEALDAEHRSWANVDTDVWLVSGAGHNFQQALMRCWYPENQLAELGEAVDGPDSRRAILNARRAWDSGQLDEMFTLYARSLGKTRIVTFLDRLHDTLGSLLQSKGYRAERQPNNIRVHYIKELN